ncbi:MAG: alanine--tRNA ligase [Rhodospirillales bacterium]|nr:alanine--tRNA ligase [Rhodospirillales bacterium]USO07130.1 MAG: alanine--tRNA ligase [Rhodospirillales bacterium]
MVSVKDIRAEFLNFFVGKGHTHVASSPLVPQNDPTLMFANSGMVQFKNVFTGAEKRPYTRATTAQKSVRAGGKHNDLDNVGYTARHHTFFEMLGNFSFGDYFKDDAIAFAWELVTKNFDMNKDKLLVTVHSSDEEAAAIWKKVAGFHDSKIIRIPTNDNFWMMGDTGPCGPCSEIFYDQGDKLQGGPPGSPDQDGDRFLEFWNLVFMQFEQEPDGKGGHIRKPLPRPSIDTGMGLERIAALLQGKYSNYDIDLLRSIIEHVAQITGVNPDGPQAASHRVIADHLRCSAFLLADGVMPSNEGRGYVLRRIMRRGMRHAHILGAQEPLMYKLVPTLISTMGEAYPELIAASALITETLKLEETRFKRTLERGLRLLDDETQNLAKGGTLSGEVAFKLYDTYGFPVDLTADALKPRGIAVDMDEFNASMEKQKEEARKHWAGSGEAANDKVWFEILEQCGPSEFLGYAQNQAEGKALALIREGARVKEAKAGETVWIVANQTPFYAESGGQVGDEGRIAGEGFAGEVFDCQKHLGKIWAHGVRVTKGTIREGDAIDLSIDIARRDFIRGAHSATHLLHEALRRRLGTHVAQKGSLQTAGRTRFDISQPVPMSAEDISAVETEVNARIRANSDIVTRVMPLDEARESGAMALFGEKYDSEVRVVSMGGREDGAAKEFSVELCGGTHAKRTGDIGAFKIVSESAVSAGIRRIEAVTGDAAIAYLSGRDSMLQKTAQLLKAAPDDVPGRVEALVEERKRLEKEVADLRRKLAAGGGGAAAPEVKEVGGVKFTARVLADIPAGDLKPLADDLKSKLGSGVIALVAINEGKASLVVAVTDDLTKKFSAVDLVKAGAEALGGKGGGGRPDMAQAGGPDGSRAEDAVRAIESKLAA